MDFAPPDLHDSHDTLLQKARFFHAKHEEKKAVIARIKGYFEPWKTDTRLKIMASHLLRDIEKFEREEAEMTNRGDSQSSDPSN